ncbi:hypothetical protein DPMN_100970 [Dreissena polymorpha]|uniref:MAM domain-containing protein n=1 Tax=Dreissena polymorpha TaxID=45954 RepID=A0A9D4R961_DREPO|nr:hypothetical protein DPMN_100970 [Dreissena polymorpha]
MNSLTNVCIIGAYIVLKSSAPALQGVNAILQSPKIDSTWSRDFCLNFWYSMTGDSIESPNAYIKDAVSRRLMWPLSLDTIDRNGEKR